MLVVAMTVAMLAINTNAAVTMQGSHDLLRVYYRDGESQSTAFPESQNTVANGTSISIVDDGTGNNALEFAFNGSGAYDGKRIYALMQERFNKDLEEIKKSQYIMNNAISEIKNTLEATNSRITEAEDRISEL